MLKVYGFWGFIKLIIDVIYTRLFYPVARIVRRPFYIRGRRYVKLGKNFTTGVGCRIDAFPSTPGYCLEIGEDVQINDYVHIGSALSIKIGNRVLIASKVFISDHNHGVYKGSGKHSSPFENPATREIVSAPIIIEDDVWLGEFVCVLPGVTIGKGSIVGAMSVVTRSIPPMSIAVGSPAKVIKVYDVESSAWVNV
ncbi:acetyltransferase [Pseudomonas orientalis]|uniref:acetyltransferase n=1 Tax=Pseudomonas orientalis TaxID=76758 RepID=UPI000CECD276|nr:acetyltransferase [Pseudomonas orientalis]